MIPQYQMTNNQQGQCFLETSVLPYNFYINIFCNIFMFILRQIYVWRHTWLISLGYSNKTITQKLLVIAQYRATVR